MACCYSPPRGIVIQGTELVIDGGYIAQCQLALIGGHDDDERS